MRKAYRYIINDFAENIRCFDENYSKFWGRVEYGKDGQAYQYVVLKDTLAERLRIKNYEFESIKKDLDKVGIIQRNSKNKFVWNTSVNGKKGNYVVLNIKENFL